MLITFEGHGSIFENPASSNYGNLSGGLIFTGMTPAAIIKLSLPYFFVIAGLVLFVMIVFGGFTIFTSTGNPEKIKQGQAMIVNAVIGFVIMFAAYWIIQILEMTLGFKITA